MLTSLKTSEIWSILGGFTLGLMSAMIMTTVIGFHGNYSNTLCEFTTALKKTTINKSRLAQQIKVEVDLAFDENLEDPKPGEFESSQTKLLSGDQSLTPRVLCWIMTTEENIVTRAIHVRNTWGKRCNKLLFFSETDNNKLPAIGLGGKAAGAYDLSAKTFKCLRYIFEKYREEAEWFFKGDDDTYCIVENLRHFLSDKDPNQPVFYGHNFKPYLPKGYFSGGAGYVLSREALNRYGSIGDGNKVCGPKDGIEDVEVGRCMHHLGVLPGNSLDRHARSLFHVFPPYRVIHGIYPDWYSKFDRYGARKGIASMSNFAITFHYLDPSEFYAMDYYVYHLRPWGYYEKERRKEFQRLARQRALV